MLNVSLEGDEMVLSQAQLTQTGSVPVECGVPLDFVMSLPEAGGPSTLGSGTPGDSPVSLVTADSGAASDAPTAATSGGVVDGTAETAAVPVADAPAAAADANATRLAWWVPVRYVSGGAGADLPGDVQWLEVRDCKARTPWPQGASWVKVNAGQYGLYRCAAAVLPLMYAVRRHMCVCARRASGVIHCCINIAVHRIVSIARDGFHSWSEAA